VDESKLFSKKNLTISTPFLRGVLIILLLFFISFLGIFEKKSQKALALTIVSSVNVQTIIIPPTPTGLTATTVSPYEIDLSWIRLLKLQVIIYTETEVLLLLQRKSIILIQV
jgi:hypothetical protein